MSLPMEYTPGLKATRTVYKNQIFKKCKEKWNSMSLDNEYENR